MKKIYEKPIAEKIEFDYRNQVVASGTDNGTLTSCDQDNKVAQGTSGNFTCA